MKFYKELLLSLFTVLIGLFVSLLLLQKYAPNLLGISGDLQLVSVDNKVAPFFDNAFPAEDQERSNSIIIQDPFLSRGRPFLNDFDGSGPHDLLGFRNRSIPHRAQIVTIGDSQTYGLNAALENNWPETLSSLLKNKEVSLYNMAMGGWGAIQYWEAFNKALHFQPGIIIVAFYSGNDALETVLQAYSRERWHHLIPEGLSKPDMSFPKPSFPVPAEQQWSVKFSDNHEVIFTPNLRLLANDDVAAVNAGYAIMANVAKSMQQIADQNEIELYFTVIPSKELVYAERVIQEVRDIDPSFSRLVEMERKNIETLAERLKTSNSQYIDLISELSRRARVSDQAYPSDSNGHPLALGYATIATQLYNSIATGVPQPLQGLVAIPNNTSDGVIVSLIRDGGRWTVPSQSIAIENGWDIDNLLITQYRNISDIPWRGFVETIDRKKFGPLDE